MINYFHLYFSRKYFFLDNLNRCSNFFRYYYEYYILYYFDFFFCIKIHFLKFTYATILIFKRMMSTEMLLLGSKCFHKRLRSTGNFTFYAVVFPCVSEVSFNDYNRLSLRSWIAIKNVMDINNAFKSFFASL